jgi:hypothetical protein
VLHTVTEGDRGFVKRRKRVEFILYGKITIKISWLFLAKTLESLCDTENYEFFGDLKTL